MAETGPIEAKQGAVRTRSRMRQEIEKFADDAYAIVRERLAIKHSEKQLQALREVSATNNIGGYVPALTVCGVEKVRELILARADAYADAFTTFGVSSDEQAVQFLTVASKQIVGGAISGIRGQLDLLTTRIGIPLSRSAVNLNRKMEQTRNSAVKEGALNLERQRINFQTAGRSEQRLVDVSSMRSPTFWRRLRKEFEILAEIQLEMLEQPTHPQWLKAYCAFSPEFGAFGKCRIIAGLDGRFISDFEDIATRGALALGCKPDVEPVGFWLFCVAQDLLHASKPVIREEFSPGDKNGGYIPGLLYSSAGYCCRRATKAELQPRADGHDPTSLVEGTASLGRLTAKIPPQVIGRADVPSINSTEDN